MDLFQALILGIVQGVTEYIPVSSSAHLVLTPWLLGWPDAPFSFEVLVQWGTLVGVFIFFRADIWLVVKGVLQGLARGKPLETYEARLGWLVVVATIPTVVIGLVFKDSFETLFAAPLFAGVLLLVTAAFLVIAEQFGPGGWGHEPSRELQDMTWRDALIIGFWQAAALLPGVSRSGSTISGGMLRRFNRVAAARFSFLMSIPALVGAGVLVTLDLVQTGELGVELPAILIGSIAAAVSGYLCIRWLLNYLQRHSLYVFAAYCAGLAMVTLVTAVVRG